MIFFPPIIIIAVHGFCVCKQNQMRTIFANTNKMGHHAIGKRLLNTTNSLINETEAMPTHHVREPKSQSAPKDI